MRVTTKRYIDGVAFVRDGEEIAFYSNVTGRITYSRLGIVRAYTDYYCTGDLELPVEDNLFILEEVKKYISR